jgi:hypothetical protein
MREAPIKLKRAKNEAAGLSESFVAALEKDNPSLLSKLVANTAADDTDQFTIEMSAAPTPDWTKLSKSGATAPKLGDFGTQIKLREMLIARSGAVASNLDDFSMDLIEEHPVDDNTRKRTVFELVSSSKDALQTLFDTLQGAIWKGYTLRFFQPAQSEYGYKFTLNVSGFPEPVKSYSLAQWVELVHSQGISSSGTTCIKWGKHEHSGTMNSRTNTLEIWLNPQACANHGLDGYLSDAGTPNERLGKRITYPPPSFGFFRNPMPESAELISDPEIGLRGQYYTANPRDRPHPQNPTNGMMELTTSKHGTLIDPPALGKFYVRHLNKPGHCTDCWGPQHKKRRGTTEETTCPYTGICRSCLAVLKNLPNKGFHHCCPSLVVDVPRPAKESKGDRKRKFTETIPNPGKPQSNAQNAFEPPAADTARRGKIEALRLATQVRIEKEKAEAAVRAAAEAEAEKIREERRQALLPRIREERAFQAAQDESFAPELAASAHERFVPHSPQLSEEQQLKADLREAEKILQAEDAAAKAEEEAAEAEAEAAKAEEMDTDDEEQLAALLDEPVTPAPVATGMEVDANGDL